jgi:hypothetical protein
LFAELAIEGLLHRRSQLIERGVFGLFRCRTKLFSKVSEDFVLEGRFACEF